MKYDMNKMYCNSNIQELQTNFRFAAAASDSPSLSL